MLPAVIAELATSALRVCVLMQNDRDEGHSLRNTNALRKGKGTYAAKIVLLRKGQGTYCALALLAA